MPRCPRCLRSRRSAELTAHGTCAACTYDLWGLGLFPVLLTPEERFLYPDCPLSIPLSAVTPHWAQAAANYRRDLHWLADRGGLSPVELHAVMQDRHYYPGDEQRPQAWTEAVKFLRIVVADDPRG